MALTIAPTTELEAVNEMLTAIGTTPVESLGLPGLTDASIAQDTLSNVSREVQAQGWWFNTKYNLTVALSGGWEVPANYLSMRPARGNFTTAGETKQFVMMEDKLWDLTTNAEIVSGSVKADVIILQQFEDLPQAARRYITVRSARIFQTKVLGSDQLGVFTDAHELEAWGILEEQALANEPASTIFMMNARRRFAGLRRDPSVAQRTQQGNQ